MGMLYLTKTPDLVVKVNNREGMGVEKLVNATAINVIKRVHKFKSTKKLNMTFRLHPVNTNLCRSYSLNFMILPS